MAMAREYVLKGGIDYAKKMLMTAFGPEHAKRLVDRLVKTLGSELASFDTLQKADPQQLAKFIHNEHPQTIALILSHLNASQAAGLLVSLPQELRADVALRMANLDQISPEIVSKIAVIIGQKLRALGEMNRESYGGVRAVSEMFNRLDSGTSKDILEAIEENDPKLVETIRQLMFVFEDLLLLSGEALQGNARESGSQDPDGGAQGDQRTIEESHPAADVPTRRRDAQRRHGSTRANQDQGSGGGPATDYRRDPATGGGWHHQLEGDGGRAICRLRCVAAAKFKLNRWPGSTCRHWTLSAGEGYYPTDPGRAAPGVAAGFRAARAALLATAEHRIRMAHQQGYEEGQAAARQAFSAHLEAMQEKLARTIEEMTSLRPRYRHEAEQDVVGLALAVARRILHRELTVSPEALLGLVKAALEKVDAREVNHVRVARQDAPLVLRLLRENGPSAPHRSHRRSWPGSR